jgi:hypothetical protein
MRELIGYLVARSGAEDAAARMAAEIPARIPCRQFVCRGLLCKQFRCRGDRGLGIIQAPADNHPTNNIRTDNILADCVRTGSPITIFYSREDLSDDAIAEIAGAIPDPSVFDCGSRAGPAAGEGARRT